MSIFFFFPLLTFMNCTNILDMFPLTVTVKDFAFMCESGHICNVKRIQVQIDHTRYSKAQNEFY